MLSGFAAAVNQGLQQGSAPWVLILNPDAQLASGALCALLERAQADATVGCVGPRTLDDDGAEYPSRRSFPSTVTAAVHGFLGSLWPANPATRRYHADGTPRDWSSVVDWAQIPLTVNTSTSLAFSIQCPAGSFDWRVRATRFG